jgi:branched-chain amino acid aminotransferase
MIPEFTQNLTVWFDGCFVPASEARVSLFTHALHYGTAIFEGIRGYWAAERREMFLVRAEDHFRRWRSNCRILGIEFPESPHRLSELAGELVRRNRFETDIYVRPLAWRSSPRLGIYSDENYALALLAIPFGVYIDSRQGIHACVSSWRRVEDNAIPARGKICGSYVNSALATDEARRNGFQEAILLNESGHVAEGSASNIFLVRRGRLVTPGETENILEGLTRDCVIEIARRELRLEVLERPIDRSELYVAEEVFLTGTAVEIAPVVKIDHRPVGNGQVGPITARLREIYLAACHGRLPRYQHWLQPVYHWALNRIPA